MKITTTNKILGIAVILLLIFTTIMYFSKENYKHKAIVAELKLQDTAHYFQTKVDAFGKAYGEQVQVNATQKEALESGLLREEELKAKNIKTVQSLVKAQEIASFWKDSVIYYRHNPTIITLVDSATGDTINYMKVPQPFDKSDQWFSIAGDITKEGIILDSIKIISEPTITIGFVKEHWYKKGEWSVIYENNNPYFKLSKLSNVVIKEKKHFYQKNGFWFGSGVVVGAGVIIGVLLL